jgi:hypothetical protein
MTNITVNGTVTDQTANSISADQMANEKGRFVMPGDSVYLYVVSSAITEQISFGTANDTFMDFKGVSSVGTSLAKSDHLVGTFNPTQAGELSLKFRETGNVSTTDLIWSVEIERDD